MKNLFILLIAVFALISCTDDDANPVTPGTNKVIYSPKKITVYSVDKGTKVYNLTHDDKGNVLTEICDGNSRKTITYDGRGNRLTKTNEYYSSENNNWYCYDSLINVYNNQNLVIKSTRKIYSSITISSYTYDSNDNILVINTSEEEFGTIDYSRTSYTYNSDNKVVTELEESLYNNTWYNSGKITNTYNEDGQKVTALYQGSSNGVLVNNYIETYSYDSTNSVMNTLIQVWNTDIWIINMRFNSVYDTNHNITSFSVEIYQNDSWVYDRKFIYKYNANGLLTEMEYFKYINGSWQYTNNGLTFGERSCYNYWFSATGYKMIVEYTAFETDTKSANSLKPNPMPNFEHNEMSDRLKSFKRFEK